MIGSGTVVDDPSEVVREGKEFGPRQDLIEQLTPRELEILGLVCDGHSNDEISILLDIRLPTVKYHVNNVFGKLSVRRRTQAVAVAVYLQLVKPSWLYTDAWRSREHLLVKPSALPGSRRGCIASDNL